MVTFGPEKLKASSPFAQRNEAPNFYGYMIRKLVKFTKELRLIVAITACTAGKRDV
jgi:hypothetical protein